MSEAESVADGKNIVGIKWAVSPSQRSGDVVEYCVNVIQGLRNSGEATNFKIGVTTRLTNRWRNPTIGYKAAGYDCMLVLYSAPATQPLASAFLEACLIQRFRFNDGCQNKAPGGEGVAAMGSEVLHTYVAVTACDILPDKLPDQLPDV